MHKTYMFLMTLEHENVESAPESELAKEAHWDFQYSYADNMCDENNYYAEELLMLRDGRVIQMVPDGDYRGRDEHYKEWAAVPREERWQKMIESAWVTVAKAIWYHQENKIGVGLAEDMTPEEIEKSLDSETPAWLAEKYAELAESSTPVYGAYRYNRKKVVTAYEHYLSSITKPFSTDPATPYANVMCMDMSDGEPNACLFVDIHT